MLCAVGLSLVQNALNECFYHKSSLIAFLRRFGVSNAVLAELNDTTTKRNFIDSLMPRLETSEKGKISLMQMSKAIASMTAFPDERSPRAPADYKTKAQAAVRQVHEYLAHKKRDVEDEKEKIKRRSEGEARRLKNISFANRLREAKVELDNLSTQIGTQESGYQFEQWFYRLAELFELDRRMPFRGQGRQIDGSVTVDGMTYLVSLKFEASQCGPATISDHRDKVNGVAEYTMGIVIAISGFTSVSIDQAGRAKSNILLFDHRHLYAILNGATTLDDLIRAAKQRASQDGTILLPL